MKLETALIVCSVLVVILRALGPSISKKWPRLAPVVQAVLTFGPDVVGLLSRKCACESCLVPATPEMVAQEAEHLYDATERGLPRPSFLELAPEDQAAWKKAAESALLRHGMAAPHPPPDPWTEALGTFEQTIDRGLKSSKDALGNKD